MELRSLLISGPLLTGLVLAGLGLSACQQSTTDVPITVDQADQADARSEQALTAADAAAFVADAETRLAELEERAGRIAWVYQTYINEDTEKLAAAANEEFTTLSTQLATEARRYRDVKVDPEVRRKLDLLTRTLVLPAPRDSAKAGELSEIVAKLDGMYGKGEFCPEPGTCWSLGDMERTLAQSRDPQEQLQAWQGWRTVSPPMKPLYARQVDLANQGARELGFADVSELWRSWYDMEPAAFSAELDRLWGQVRCMTPCTATCAPN